MVIFLPDSQVSFHHDFHWFSMWKITMENGYRPEVAQVTEFSRHWKNDLFSFLTLESVSIFHPDPQVSFHRGKIMMENACRPEKARVTGFSRHWKNDLFSFLTFGSASIFHPDYQVSFHRGKIPIENGCRSDLARVTVFSKSAPGGHFLS
ncbi:hypothetical protein [Stutzerimonas nitrititolerans]|uniref:hypothetical protein n=1 Tax=Stutzerimonas nitrititolerans TaxID=2482751 RepID=UPI0028B050FB|nr:hypothetical protein [Stutzerimonas nitrititolerans]